MKHLRRIHFKFSPFPEHLAVYFEGNKVSQPFAICEDVKAGLIGDSASAKWNSRSTRCISCVKIISVAERYALGRSFDDK